VSAAIFAFAAVAFLAGAVYLTWQAIKHRDLLRESAAVIALGLAGAMAYEAAALATGRMATISVIVAQEFALHPLQWLAWFLPVPALGGALTFHFMARRREARWFVFLGGGVAYLLGGFLAFELHWLP